MTSRYATPSPRALASGGALALSLVCAVADAHPAPPPPRTYTPARPSLELSPWVALGGGAVVGPTQSAGVFDLRIGGDVTFGVGRKDDLRLGPFAEVASSHFASFQAVGGVELFVGAIPRPLRMFLYPGEGILLLRVGAGWVLRNDNLPAARSAPVASVTVSYGYRAPFSLREPQEQTSLTPDARPLARYMTGARLWVGGVVDLDDGLAWQLTGGIEFEPVGSFRYLLGLY